MNRHANPRLSSRRVSRCVWSDIAAGSVIKTLLSNEVNELKEGQGNLQHLLTPKGKVQAQTELFSFVDFFRLVCEKDDFKTLNKNISLRIFRADVKIEDRANDFSVLV